VTANISNATLRVLPGASLTLVGHAEFPVVLENCEIDCSDAKQPLQVAGVHVSIRSSLLRGSVGVHVVEGGHLVLRECQLVASSVAAQVGSDDWYFPAHPPAKLQMHSCVIQGIKSTTVNLWNGRKQIARAGLEVGRHCEALLVECEICSFHCGVGVDGRAVLKKCSILAEEGAIVGRAPAHISIESSEISGYGKAYSTGIQFWGDGGGRLQNCTIQKFRCGAHVGLIEGDDSVSRNGKVLFKKCHIAGNRGDGLQLDLKATVEDSEISRNGGHGITVRPEGSVVSRKSRIHHNKGWGVNVDHLDAQGRENLAGCLMRSPRPPRFSSTLDRISQNGRGSVRSAEPPVYPRMKDGMPLPTPAAKRRRRE